MTSPKRVYIVEDNSDAALYAAMLVESAGLGETTILRDGLEGLAACFRDSPDALILDLELPSMRGEEVLRLLRTSKDHRHLPILVCSALPAAKRKELDLLRMGADVYLDKPLLESTFVDTLTKLLGVGSPYRSHSESTTLDREIPGAQHFIAEALEKELREEPEIRRRAPAPEAQDTPSGRQPGAGHGGHPRIPPPAADDEDSGSIYEGYRLIGMIGSGGMGTVYRAEQLKLHRVVALKVLLEDYHENPDMRERFHREALIMAQVNHPNIVQVFEAGKTDFSSYFAMEYVDGQSLETRIVESSLNWEECPSFIRQACNAIAHLHSLGIIHRDIKPSNLLISRRGLVKVTDFGISQARLAFEGRKFTEVLQFMGTPDYMAPELKRLSEANQRTDQYALGMTFWRMFAGVDAKPLGKPLNELHPELPEALSDAIGRCISLDPDNRFVSVVEARDAILEACKGTFSGTWEQYISPII